MMDKIFKINEIILCSELLNWEEKLIISKIQNGNEFYKDNYKPTVKYLSKELGIAENKIKFCLLKLISIGLITYQYLDQETEGSYYHIDKDVLNSILEEKITFIKNS